MFQYYSAQNQSGKRDESDNYLAHIFILKAFVLFCFVSWKKNVLGCRMCITTIT